MSSIKFVFVLALSCVAAQAGLAAVPQFYSSVSNALPTSVWPNYDEYQHIDGGHPQYAFAYGVDDPLTGDSKSHFEQRDGDVVRGEYSLIDADGYKRTVQYTADALNGFNAIVRREPPSTAAEVAVEAPSVAAAYDYSPPAVKYGAPPIVDYA